MNLLHILTIVVLGLLCLYGLIIFWPALRRQQRHHQLLSYEFPEAWERILRESFPLYSFMGQQAQKNFCKQLQISLGTKEFFSAGSMNLENRHRLLCAAPLLAFSKSMDKDFLPQLKRLLILDDEFAPEASLKEDAHDFSLRWDQKNQMPFGVAGKGSGVLSSKAIKALQKSFQIQNSTFPHPANLIWQFQLHFHPAHLNRVTSVLTGIKEEMYVDEEIFEEVVWGLHELICYYPEDVKKVLKTTFKDFLTYYQLNT